MELYTVMQNIGCALLHRGKIACSVADYRLDPPIERIQILTASTEIMMDTLAAVNGQTSDEALIKAESEALLASHPVICTDPSPDLARAESVMDWRSKVWRLKGREKPVLKQEPPKPAKVRQKCAVDNQRGRLEFPDTLQRVCASIGRRQN